MRRSPKSVRLLLDFTTTVPHCQPQNAGNPTVMPKKPNPERLRIHARRLPIKASYISSPQAHRFVTVFLKNVFLNQRLTILAPFRLVPESPLSVLLSAKSGRVAIKTGCFGIPCLMRRQIAGMLFRP